MGNHSLFHLIAPLSVYAAAMAMAMVAIWHKLQRQRRTFSSLLVLSERAGEQASSERRRLFLPPPSLILFLLLYRPFLFAPSSSALGSSHFAADIRFEMCLQWKECPFHANPLK